MNSKKRRDGDLYIPYLTLPWLTWPTSYRYTHTHTYITLCPSLPIRRQQTNTQPTPPPPKKKRTHSIPAICAVIKLRYSKNEPCDFPPPITDPELKYVARKDMHTALLYIAKKQLNIEERAGEVVPSPGVYGREGGKKGGRAKKLVRYLGGVTLGIPDLSSLAKALDREFCFGRKKKKRKKNVEPYLR